MHHWSARFLSIIAIVGCLLGAEVASVPSSIDGEPEIPATAVTLPYLEQVRIAFGQKPTAYDPSAPVASSNLVIPQTVIGLPRHHDRRVVESIRPICGFALCVHHIGDLDLYLQSIEEVHAMGATSLEIVTPFFQYTTDSNSIRFVRDRCPTPDQLVRLLHRAHELGMHTTLMPIVLIERRGRGDWRGKINPGDWDRWWSSYHEFIDYFVNIANAAHVDLLSVGSELNSTQGQVDRWRALIANVRSQFSGQLTYSANWDRYRDVPFWSDVDVMAVSSYFRLTDSLDGADVDDLTAGWRPHREALLDYAASRGTPVILSELGYPSLRWAGSQPWNYVAGPNERADHEMQGRCFEAFFRSWTSVLLSRHSFAAGFYVYHWDPYHRGGSQDIRYGVDGKPARGVIERHFRTLRGDLASEAGSNGPT